MSRLLASVRSVNEAKQVLRSGADIIDCKNPLDGALGSLPPKTIMRIVAAVDGKRPVSATAGNICDDASLMKNRIRMTTHCGVDYVKVALFEPDFIASQIRALEELACHHALIVVCFADRPLPADLLSNLSDSGVRGIMIDTADKTSGTLTDLWSVTKIAGFVEQARDLRLLCGLAGRLSVHDIPTLLPCQADYLGFRSALCGGERSKGIDEAAAVGVREAMPFHVRAGDATSVGISDAILH